MPIWNRYQIIKEIESNTNIKTYLTRIEPIIKEVKPKNKAEHYKITERLEKLVILFFFFFCLFLIFLCYYCCMMN